MADEDNEEGVQNRGSDTENWWVDSSYILALGLAFEQIKAGTVEYEVTGGNREYQFDGFSVIVKGDQQ